MCGFAGFIDLRPQRPSKEERLKILQQMGRQLSRRGPDDEQCYDDGKLSLVFRRLSIIDVEGGQQPIWNEDGSRFVCVNGELYNHKELRATLSTHTFRTRSDSEVALHLYEEYGPAALERLIGMFSIALWDTKEERLFLARDRMGIKPLFYAQIGGLFLFGSELKALLAHPDCPRELRFRDAHPAFSFVPHFTTPPSYLQGVQQLEGGCFALFQNGIVTERRYWAIENFFAPKDQKTSSKDADSYINTYADLFEDSVQKRLMSDVGVGAFLSGGLDSSMLVAVAARSQKDLQCFQMIEQSGWSTGEPEGATRLAKQLGLPLHRVLFDHRTLLDELRFDLRTLEYFIWALDSPRFQPEWFFKHELHRYVKTVAPEIKVILLGQGADEFAGGYSRSFSLESEDWSDYLERHIEVTRLNERRYAMERDGTPKELLPFFSESYYPIAGQGQEGFLYEMTRRIRILQSYNLWHEDRTGAAQGIEPRVPFLDHRLIELLASIPVSLHKELFYNKRIIREASARWLPQEARSQPKVGFYISKIMGSVYQLASQMLHRIFPDFREEYLERPGSIFSGSALEELLARTSLPGPVGQDSIRLMFSCISFEIFRGLCQKIPAGFLPASVGPSPLKEAPYDLRTLWGEPKEESAFLWEEEDLITLEEGLSVYTPLANAEKTELRFLRDGSSVRAIDIEPEMAWTITLFTRLGEGAPVRLDTLASLCGVDLDSLREALDLFLVSGLVRAQQKN